MQVTWKVWQRISLDIRSERPPAKQSPHIGLEQGIAGQFSGAVARGAKERPFSVLWDTAGGDVLLQISVEIVMNGHLVLLAALSCSRTQTRRPC